MEKKIFIKRFQSFCHTYLNILCAYRSDNGWFLDSGEDQINTVPFLLTTAAALECSLNDYIIEHYNNSYDEDQAKLIIPGFLSMNLKGKLKNIVPLLTNNKYIINTNHKVYQLLVELIGLRNNLVHNKGYFDMHEAYIKEDSDGNPYVEPDNQFKEILKSVKKGKTDYSLGIKQNVGEYHDALEKLHDLFFSCYMNENFCCNELIIELQKNDIDTMVLET